jgi:hypothetical protein
MNRLHALFGALVFPCAVIGVRAQGVVFREDFESGATSWTFGGIWHVEADNSPCSVQPTSSPSPGHYAWYGSQHQNPSLHCDYEQGYPGGALVLNAPVVLPQNTGSIVLRYRRFLETEYCIEGYDVTRVVVTTVGGQTELVHGSDCGIETGWVDRRLDVSAWAGQPVQIRFEFVPTDGVFNDTIGWCIDDVEIAAEPGLVTCMATGACPCGGQYDASQYVEPHEDSGGCKHSAGTEARLFGNGVQSVSADSVELVVQDMPVSTIALYVQGQLGPATTFGDGRLCMTAPFVRMVIHGVNGGEDTYPHVGEPGVAQRGALPPAGGTRMYQVVYRDAASYCTTSTFNASNGYLIAWTP